MTAVTAVPPKKKQITSLIIIRHAERIDDHRIPGGFASNGRSTTNSNLDWRLDTVPGRQRPWDPPLSLGGVEQSEAFGRLLPHLIEEFKLPPLGAVYASPVVRCVETGLAAMKAHDAELMAMKGKREEEEEQSRRPAENAGQVPPVSPIQTKGSSSLGSKFRFGGKGKKKANNMKTAAAGPDMATAVGMAHIRAPSIADIADMTADLYSATMDMLGLDDGNDGTAEKTTGDIGESKSTDKGVETSREKSPSPPTQQQKDRQIQRFEAKGPVRLRCELGLMECIHKQWYEQWCTIVEAPMDQGTVVGEHRMTIDDNDCTTSRDEKNAQEQQQSLHPMARVAVNHCFPEPRDLVSLLGEVIRMYKCEKDDIARRGNNGPRQMFLSDVKCDQRRLSDELLGRVDTEDHVEPFSTFIKDYQYEVMYETGKAGLNRQDAAIRAIAARHVGETVVCVTHYVPCAHLFGRLTGRDGVVEHGKAGYTSFSVYVHSDGREGEKHTDWRPLIINDQRHLQTPAAIRTEASRPAKKKYNLRSRVYGF